MMLAAATTTVLVLFAGWFYLLFRFHRSLREIDPVLANEIGRPSIFWTAYHGNRRLVELMRRRDLASGRYAPIAGHARILRVWAVALLAALAWAAWAWSRIPAA